MSMHFVPFTTFVDPLFWDELCQRKLNEWKLNEEPYPITATYCSQDPNTSNTRLSISYDAFFPRNNLTPNGLPVMGSVLAVNTRETFKKLDRKMILKNVAQRVKKAIETFEWLKDPTTLNTFFLTVYPDIKKYTFEYWNCIPALLFPQSVKLVEESREISPELSALISTCTTYQLNKPFLLINKIPVPLSSMLDSDFDWDGDTYVVYCDPSTRTSLPGWPLRNLLAAIAHLRKDIHRAKFICYRNGSIPSIVVHVEWKVEEKLSTAAVGWERIAGTLCPAFINLRNTLDPLKLVELSSELNLRLIRWRLVPDINLERFTELKCLVLGTGTLGCNVARALLGWGVKNITFVDDACISYSNVVRQSLFTFMDAKNGGEYKARAAAEAVRQINPLSDVRGVCMKIPMPGHTVSKPDEKDVETDVKRLEELVIEHDVTFLLLDSREARWLPTLLAARHHKLAISVALGFDCFVVIRHGVSDDDETGEGTNSDDPGLIPGSQLGCYFCSDVTAPGNSSVDRTIDQQCTVSRAGLSFAASGVAVELLAALVQYPKIGAAPARLGENDESTTVLGATPHQIRSFLSRFTQFNGEKGIPIVQSVHFGMFKCIPTAAALFHTPLRDGEIFQMTPAVRRFERCTACGTAVQEAYIKDGFQFLLRVFNSPKCLEFVSGLDQIQATATQMDLWEFDDNESVSSEKLT